MVGGHRVGEKEHAVDGVGWSRIDGIASEDEDYEDEWVYPCVAEGDGFPAPEEGFGFSSL